MKRAVGTGGRWIVFWGLLIFLTLLKSNALQALEVTPVNSYLNLLEGSIFHDVAGNGYSRDVPSYVTEKVAFYIERFTTRERDLFQQWLDRAGPYIPLIREIFREEGLPENLVLLPLIESGFRVDARSPKKATGLWQFMAALIIAKNPDVFGFTFSEGPSTRYDIVEVPGGMEISSIAKDAGTDYQTLRGLNPELKGNILPFDRPHYALRLPEGKGAVFLEKYNNLPLSQRIVYREHKVKKGDTVYSIARRYGTGVAAIREANRLNRRYTIIPGDVLLVPVRLPVGAGDVRLVDTSEDIEPEQPEAL